MAGPVEDEKCLIFVKENFYFSNEICSRLSYVTSNSIYSWWGPILCTVKMQKAHFILSFKTGDRVGDFLEGAKDGAIFISFGSILQGSAMSDDRRRLFLNVFRFFSFSVLLSSFFLFSFFSFLKKSTLIHLILPLEKGTEPLSTAITENQLKAVLS